MKTKEIIKETFLLLALSMFFASPSAWATIRHFPSGSGSPSYATIQAAIAAAAAGDEIYIHAGTHTVSGQIVINKDNLWIYGDDPTTTILKKAEDTGNPGSFDLRAWFLVTADVATNLEFSHMTLDGTGRNISIGILSHAKHIWVHDCEIKNIGWQGGGPPNYYGRGICIYGGEITWANQITQCSFSNIGRIGVFTYGVGVVTNVTDSYFVGKGPGDWLDYAFEAGGGAELDVYGNEISNCRGVAAVDGSESAGLLGTTYFALGTALSAEWNTITNCTTAAAIGYDSADDTLGVFRKNNLAGNDKAISNSNPTNIVYAPLNWYGTNTPSGVAAQVDEGVDYSPWLDSDTDIDPTIYFDPDLSILWVDDDSPKYYPALGIIQEGIDLVSGSTVNVAAGTYDEPVNIEGKKEITIIGDDKATVIVKPTSTLNWDACGQTSGRKAVLRIVNSTDVVLQNMTMDFDLVKANGVFGIFGCDSTVTVDNCILKNMSVPDASGGYTELGTYFRAPGFTDEARADITITNNTFIDTGRVGVVTHDYSYATIDGNTFYKTTDDFGYAIEMGSRSKGVIKNNIIYGYDTPAASDGSESAGIYIENAFTGTIFGGPGPHVVKNVTMENNEIYDCQYGMWIGNGYDGYAGDVDIVVSLINNNFHNNIDGGLIIQDEDKADGSSVTVNGSGNTLLGNGSYGYHIYTQGDGNITVNLIWDTISANETGIMVEDFASGSSNSSYSVSITQSDIVDNSTYGINNTVSSFTVNAENNWWGHASGPLDPSGTNETDGVTCYDPSTMKNSDGTGNRVSDLNVDYCPWHTYQDPDIDDDGICNPYTIDPSCEGSDNCPLTPNPGQEDTYPPDGNGLGDACECEGNFDCDQDVDADDVVKFLWDLGRNQYSDPCTNERFCYGDFECNGNVDSADVTKFLEDFGRNRYHNPCPGCIPETPWCAY